MKFTFGDFGKNFGRERIYADWAATTPIRGEVEKVMKKARKMWANPSAIYREGVEAKRALENMRAKSAKILGVKPEEVYFTSGGTEANAMIIQGVLRRHLERAEGVHIVASAIEHSSVLETLKIFEKRGVKVTYVSPRPDGVVRADEILAVIKPDTVLVTCMYANNEIGTVQPVSKIGAGIRKIRAEKLSDWPVFHVDASQAPLWLSCELEGLRADAMTLDAHKMQGPKGVGALVVRRHVNFEPLMVGGGQEHNKRPTTESLELITGFTVALEIAQREREEKSKKAKKIQKYFFAELEKKLPQAITNGSLEKRLPNNVNISLPNISDPEMAVLMLDKAGIACSTKSSCLKGEENSYVVEAMISGDLNRTDGEVFGVEGKSDEGGASNGAEKWRARNTLRFTFSAKTNHAEIDTIITSLKMLK
ncbi:MAG: cysteine desulfurase family protein [bacterium]|nr:cysteine desulfurase family protein [bacterium]